MILSDWRNKYFSKLEPFLGNEEVHSSILCGSTIFLEIRTAAPAGQRRQPQARATSVMCDGLRPTTRA